MGAVVVCAIHQPNFFPWLGYFDKIARSDVFVFLDDVAYPRSGSGMGSWVNRVRIDIQGRPAWVGCPLRRAGGRFPIREAVIDDQQPWRAKLVRTLELNYKHAPGFQQAFPVLLELIEHPEDRLCEFNVHAIGRLCEVLGVDARFVRQSELDVAGAGTELLVSIVKAVRATTYLCGGGAGGYQQDELFAAADLELRYQNLVQTAYGDPARWLPGLSIIDFLMQARPEERFTSRIG